MKSSIRHKQSLLLMPDVLVVGCDPAGRVESGQVGQRPCGVVRRFRDPAFDPNEPAFHYLRAIENPGPRWSACSIV